MSLGFWHGRRLGQEGTWLRLFRPDGSLVLTTEEQAAAEKERAEVAEERAAAAEAEVARLQALLEKLPHS